MIKRTRTDSAPDESDVPERDPFDRQDEEPFVNDEMFAESPGEERFDAPDESFPAADADPRDAEIAALIAERDTLTEQNLRLRAEFDNARKRLAREADRTARVAAERLFLEWLPVVDNLELALQHAPDRNDSLAQGVELVLKQVCDLLSRHGVEPIAAVGEVFSPHLHEAMTHSDSDDVPENRVSAEFQRGYKMGDQVLRPTKVAVSRGKAATDDGGQNA